MTFEELCNRYGSHVARRVQQELDSSELDRLESMDLLTWLETRAETAHKEYQTRLENPFVNEELGPVRAEYIDVLYRRWQSAEELAYLVTIAEDAGQARAVVGGNPG